MGSVGHAVKSLQNVLHTWLHVAVMCCLLSGVLGAEMCTKSVPVQREPSKKVHVLRRVPASCSNWEKAWSWITKKDCGTKYRLDLVDIPSQKVVTYRMKKVCCEGDLKCKQAQANGLETPGLDVSDEKFLAIVLGSTAAALFVLVLVISISLCRKKKQCTLLCEERRHIYANADDGDESSELHGQKGCGPDDEETENKVCESEYAEINDCGLPRYTDIFKEATAGSQDPFTRASAPPLSAYDSCTVNQRPRKPRDRDENNVKEVLQGTADILERESKQQRKQGDGAREDREYYNLAAGGAMRDKDQAAGCAAQERTAAAVVSLTQDHPAVVVTASGASSPSSPSSPANTPHSQPDTNNAASCCDTHNDDDDDLSSDPRPVKHASAKKKISSSAYESLAQREGKDGHEYQRLLRRQGPSNDIEMNGLSEGQTEGGDDDEEGEEVVGLVDDEGAVVTKGPLHETARC